MPFGDGTGPMGQGPGNRRGMGAGQGRRMGVPGLGPEGFCLCPQCGEKVPHQRGNPCYSINCPKCGTRMIRA